MSNSVESSEIDLAEQSPQVQGDNIRTGDIDGGGAVAIGREARATVNRYTEIIIKADNFEDQPPAPGEPPYKGLTYFSESDKDIYFGRETLSDLLAARLDKSRFLALIGASGSGKSSLLRAGIIPRLRAKNWAIHTITPGAHPITVLAASLTRDELDPASTGKIQAAMRENPDSLVLVSDKLAARENADRLLLAVDQFEELFTLCKKPDEQKAFVDNLVHAARADGATTILLSMRADFYDHLSQFNVLTDLVSQQQEYVKPMAEEDLVRVIAEPARRGGWQFVEGLVEQMVIDAGSEPGRLPLLSHALLKTWEDRRGVIMTLGGYLSTGGVEGAIAQTAEDILQQLGMDKEPVVRHVFLSLTEIGEDAEVTRRVASRQELLRYTAAGQETINYVLNSLADARLIIIEKDQVQVAHEALIRRWPRLLGWIDEDRERLSFNRRLQRAVEEWQKTEHNDDYLFRGSQLTQAKARIEEYKDWQTSPLQDEFIRASDDLAAREADKTEEIIRTGFENALLLYGFAGIGGALGTGGAALLFTIPAGLRDFLVLFYILIAMGIGAFTGILYVGVLDRLTAAVKKGPGWQAWLVSVVVGAIAFALCLWWLTIAFGGISGLIMGAVWGAVAGAGRLWMENSERGERLKILFVILGSGLFLGGTFQLASRLFPQQFANWPDSFPAWVMFLIGAFVPLMILLADEFAASYFSRRRK
ncbi:MAG: hypothetical protein ACK2UJ_04355 [Candidatus Promineifilaceae bacterium]